MSNYGASTYARPITLRYSSACNPNYDQQRESLVIVPRLHSTLKDVPFRVCRTYRDRNNVTHIWILEDKTLEQLKEEICRQLNIMTQSRDVSLTIFDESELVWEPINDTNVHKTIIDFKFPSYPTINVEKREATNTNQHRVSNMVKSDLILKLCERPMDKSIVIVFDTYSTITMAQLKEEARKRVSSEKTKHLFLWAKDHWTKFELELDDITLVGLGFQQYSIISFATEHDSIPGVCGLSNLGNTCFINSALQCLSNIPEFTRRILSLGNDCNAPIIGTYSALIKTMWSGDCDIVTPSSLLLNIREDLPRFSRYKQQDAQEFMNYFLHLIHQEFTNEEILITDLFYGRIQSDVKCLGGCRSIETNEEQLSFLPVPIANDVNQYDILYLGKNGEQRLISLRICARTIDILIQSFIEQYEPQLSSRQIEVVRIVNNRITERLYASTLLNNTIKHQLAFIEVAEKTVEQRYIEFVFLNRETHVPFRPPVFVIRPLYECRYSDLSKQISEIQNHLSSITGAPTDVVNHLYWTNDTGDTRRLKFETNENDTLLFMDHITIEMGIEWIDKYNNHYKLDRPLGRSSLTSLLVDFFREDILNGDYYCSHCLSLTKANQKTSLALPLPLVLIIQLKRFTYETYSDIKIDAHVDFPLTGLDLSEFVTQNDGKKVDVSALYDLVAVSNHTGTLACGHYTTYAKNDRNKKWYSFNDERIREIKDEADVVTKNAYILVYVKRTSP